MTHSLSTNPVKLAQNWHKAAKTQGPTLDQAVKQFRKDFSRIRSKDRDQFTPTTESSFLGKVGGVFRESPSIDTDSRRGEVEVPGLGSFHSTPEGYSLKLMEQSQTKINIGFIKRTPSKERAYEINKDNGTITVTNAVGPGESKGWVSSTQSEPYTENYVIDMKNGIVRDYSRTVTPGDA